MYVENRAPCDWYHFYTYGDYGSGVGNHEYRIEYDGLHYSQHCFWETEEGDVSGDVETYIFEFSIDGTLKRSGALGGLHSGLAVAQTELHNYTETPPYNILEDAGINYFTELDLYDGSDWRCWSTGVCDADHPWIVSLSQIGGGVPPYQYDRLNPSTADYYSFKAWGRPGDADYDGTQNPQDPDDDNDSLGVGDPLWFRDEVEDFVGTRSFDPCSDDTEDFGAYPPFDAWPPDINMDRSVDVTGDVYMYVGRIGACLGSPEYHQRLDLDLDWCISVTGDVFEVMAYIGLSCP
jgi:hypothetical protein